MSEKAEAKRDGAKLTPNSGRGKHNKGDARLSIFTVDYKEAKSSFTLNKRVWAKVQRDAIANSNSTPALKIIIGEEIKERLWIVQEHIIHDYVRLLEEEQARLDEEERNSNTLGGVIRGDMEK